MHPRRAEAEAIKLLQEKTAHGMLVGAAYMQFNDIAATSQLSEYSVAAAKKSDIEAFFDTATSQSINSAMHPGNQLLNFMHALDSNATKMTDEMLHAITDKEELFRRLVQRAQDKNKAPKTWLNRDNCRRYNRQSEIDFRSSPDHRLNSAGHVIIDTQNIDGKPLKASAIVVPKNNDLARFDIQFKAEQVNLFLADLYQADAIVPIFDWPLDTSRNPIIFDYRFLNAAAADSQQCVAAGIPLSQLKYTTTLANNTLAITSTETGITKQIKVLPITVLDLDAFSHSPELAVQVRELIKAGGNIVVHCGSSVGRTGQFLFILKCLLDTELMQQIENMLQDPTDANIENCATRMQEKLYEIRCIRYAVQSRSQITATVAYVVAEAKRMLALKQQIALVKEHANEFPKMRLDLLQAQADESLKQLGEKIAVVKELLAFTNKELESLANDFVKGHIAKRQQAMALSLLATIVEEVNRENSDDTLALETAITQAYEWLCLVNDQEYQKNIDTLNELNISFAKRKFKEIYKSEDLLDKNSDIFAQMTLIIDELIRFPATSLEHKLQCFAIFKMQLPKILEFLQIANNAFTNTQDYDGNLPEIKLGIKKITDDILAILVSPEYAYGYEKITRVMERIQAFENNKAVWDLSSAYRQQLVPTVNIFDELIYRIKDLPEPLKNLLTNLKEGIFEAVLAYYSNQAARARSLHYIFLESNLQIIAVFLAKVAEIAKLIQYHPIYGNELVQYLQSHSDTITSIIKSNLSFDEKINQAANIIKVHCNSRQLTAICSDELKIPITQAMKNAISPYQARIAEILEIKHLGMVNSETQPIRDMLDKILSLLQSAKLFSLQTPIAEIDKNLPKLMAFLELSAAVLRGTAHKEHHDSILKGLITAMSKRSQKLITILDSSIESLNFSEIMRELNEFSGNLSTAKTSNYSSKIGRFFKAAYAESIVDEYLLKIDSYPQQQPTASVDHSPK